jgi:raffinose/stachyose/melibiose transport system permease protein
MENDYRRKAWIALLLTPALAVVLFVIIVPMFSALMYSFYGWNGFAREGFVGLKNYQDILFLDPFSRWTFNAFANNLIVVGSLMVVKVGGAFVFAYCLYLALPGHKLHRVVVFLPVVLSAVIVGGMWKLLLNPIFGAVNVLLVAVGLEAYAQPWLGQSSTALPSIIGVSVWHYIGFSVLVYLSGMQRISSEVLEAARLDGASHITLMRKIIWPLVAPATTIVVMITFIGSFNMFEIPYILAGVDGAPAGQTDVLGLYFYRTAFGSAMSGVQDFGRASALAVLMFIFIGVIAGFATRWLRNREIEL